MARGSDGCRVTLGHCHLSPGLISSSPGTAGLPPFIAFSTSSPELDFAASKASPFHDFNDTQVLT
jgi:hypothetical protein